MARLKPIPMFADCTQHRFSRNFTLSFFVLTSLCAAGPTGCSDAAGPPEGHGTKGGEPEQAALAIEFTGLETADIERYHRTSGNLKALRRAEIRPTQAGIIRSLDVEEGDRVEPGQLLARLDGRAASLAAKRDRMQEKNAKQELGRLESIARNAIASEELDKQRYALETARAAARLSKHQATLSTIRAPFAGVITARTVDIGNFASSADVLFELVDLSGLELDLHLPEREASRVQIEAAVTIELLDGTLFQGTVLRRSPIVDSVTGTIKFTVRMIEFPDSAIPGAFVRARVLLEARRQVATLPVKSIVQVGGKPHVYLLINGKASRQVVETGLEGKEKIELISGIETDAVVVKDASGITEGMALKKLGQTPPSDAEGHGPSKGREKSH